MKRFNEKTVIVTGAASGIGKAIALAFAEEGACVCCVDTDIDGLAVTIEDIGELVGTGEQYSVDVSNTDQVSSCVSNIVKYKKRIDVLVNNAGINQGGRISDLAESHWDATIDVNLKSTFLFSKAVWPHFEKQKSGNIINISSIMGQVGGVDSPAYCASKAGIIMFSRCLAKDGALHGIRVNTICPGYIETPNMVRYLAEQDDPDFARANVIARQPMGRMGTPEEVARGALFLASGDATYISGSELTIDGAVTATQIDE